MRSLIGVVLFAVSAFAQGGIRFAATTGDVSLTASGTTATLQSPATGGNQVAIEMIVVYCSVACNVTQYANGTGATATAGTVTPILPAPLNSPILATFWTSSNVGTGTQQGQVFHMQAGSTQGFCLSTVCGNSRTVALGTGGVNNNYSVTISSITGTANITMYGVQAP